MGQTLETSPVGGVSLVSDSQAVDRPLWRQGPESGSGLYPEGSPRPERHPRRPVQEGLGVGNLVKVPSKTVGELFLGTTNAIVDVLSSGLLVVIFLLFLLTGEGFSKRFTIVMALIIAVPQLALWLPGLMR